MTQGALESTDQRPLRHHPKSCCFVYPEELAENADNPEALQRAAIAAQGIVDVPPAQVEPAASGDASAAAPTATRPPPPPPPQRQPSAHEAARVGARTVRSEGPRCQSTPSQWDADGIREWRHGRRPAFPPNGPNSFLGPMKCFTQQELGGHNRNINQTLPGHMFRQSVEPAHVCYSRAVCVCVCPQGVGCVCSLTDSHRSAHCELHAQVV
jgi:hypothetical protein